MNILALDLSTNTGWATNYKGKRSGVEHFPPKKGESPGMRFLRFRAWLHTMKDFIGKIDLIVYEKSGSNYRSMATVDIIVGLQTEVQAFAAEQWIELMVVNNSELKKWATGKGNAGKPEMIAHVKTLKWSCITDDNEADAILLLEYAIKELRL